MITNTDATSKPVDLAGVLTGFTGNIFVNDHHRHNHRSQRHAAPARFAARRPNKTINLDQFYLLADNNQVTGTGTAGDPLTGTQAPTTRPPAFTRSPTPSS